MTIIPFRQNNQPGAMVIIDNGGGSAAAWISGDEIQSVIDQLATIKTGLAVVRSTNHLGRTE